jgi:hypothetical protein
MRRIEDTAIRVFRERPALGTALAPLPESTRAGRDRASTASRDERHDIPGEGTDPGLEDAVRP